MRTKTTKQQSWRVLIPVAIALAIAAGGCEREPTPTPLPIVTAPPTPSGPGFSGGIVASGRIVPDREANLSFTTAGRVGVVSVTKGEQVKSGDGLVRLETDLLEARVTEAEAALARAEADLALASAGPRPQEVTAAQARLRASEAALSQAAAERDRPELGATEAEVAAVRAEVATATADRLAAEEFHNRTMECIEVKWGGEQRTICPLLGPAEEKARYTWQAAEESLEAARAKLDALGPTGAAEERVAQASMTIATAEKDAASAKLETVQAGATPESVAVAEASVKQARAELEAARVALDQATLRAPFSGTVTAVEMHPGEAIAPAQVVLTLADLGTLRVETTDLSERDVAQVSVGQEATVYVEPLDAKIGGQVVAVASQASTVGGDVVFTVTITLDDQPAGLRWGMTVEVEIGNE